MSQALSSIGCLALALIGIPIWALVAASRARRESGALREEIQALSDRLVRLEKRLWELRRGLREPPGAEPAEPQSEPRETPPPIAAAPPVPPAHTPPPPVPAAVSQELTPPELPTSRPPIPLDVPAPLRPPPTRSFDWENLISVRAFAWLGGAALFLAAALFLQYSIQQGLISPAMRVAIGLVVGAVAFIGGDILRPKAEWAGQAASGAGVAVLYASLFAAHSRYHLLGTAVTFAAMALVTVAAGLMALRREAFAVAVLGLVGGFATPWLLSTGEDRPLSLLTYVLLLDVGIVAVARRRLWPSITLMAMAGSIVLYAGWAQRFLDPPRVPWALLAALVIAAIFAVPAPQKTDPKSGELPRGATIGAIGSALLLALLVAGDAKLGANPAVLVPYLLVLAGGAFVVARRDAFAPLLPIAAAFSLATLLFRVQPDLFPANRATSLALFALVPCAFLLFWRQLRGSSSEGFALAAASLLLFGSFFVMMRAFDLEPRAEPVLPLWLFVAAHAAAAVGIGSIKRSGGWVLGAQALTLAATLETTTRFERGRLDEFLPLILVPAVLFWLLPFVSDRLRNDREAWLSGAAAPVAHFVLLYWLAKPAWGTTVLGAVAVVCGALSFASLRRVLVLPGTDAAARRFASALFGAVTLLFVTAAIPILLDRQWITVAWALEAAALAWLATRIPENGLVYASAGLAAATFIRLLLNKALWEYQPRSGTPVFNWYLYTFAIPAVTFLFAARWLSRNELARAHRLPGLLRAAAGVLLFVLLNVEIADIYSTGPTLAFRLSGGGLAEDMTYSLAWGVFALILLGLGIRGDSKPTRAAALGVLLPTIGKVFLHDLWDLGALYRVGSIVGLAIALLAVSFLTQRFVFSKRAP